MREHGRPEIELPTGGIMHGVAAKGGRAGALDELDIAEIVAAKILVGDLADAPAVLDDIADLHVIGADIDVGGVIIGGRALARPAALPAVPILGDAAVGFVHAHPQNLHDLVAVGKADALITCRVDALVIEDALGALHHA